MYEDKTLKCKDCGADFVFTAGEQEFYAQNGFTNEPKRCKACRDAKKNGGAKRELFTAVCAGCAARLRFLSSPVTTDPFTAASASLRETSTKFIGNTNRFGF